MTERVAATSGHDQRVADRNDKPILWVERNSVRHWGVFGRSILPALLLILFHENSPQNRSRLANPESDTSNRRHEPNRFVFGKEGPFVFPAGHDFNHTAVCDSGGGGDSFERTEEISFGWQF